MNRAQVCKTCVSLISLFLLSTGQPVTGHFFFTPSAFSVPACFQSGAPPRTPGGAQWPLTAVYSETPSAGLAGLTNFDLSLEKRANLVGERVQLLFRAEFNVLNHTTFLSPLNPVSVTSSPIGQVRSTRDARIGQLAVKLVF